MKDHSTISRMITLSTESLPMQRTSLFRLILLAAIFGASFLFMRLSVTSLGPVTLITCRVACAAVFLAVVAYYVQTPLSLKQYWRHYLILGLFNAALPFLLFALAARSLSVSLMAIFNATTPLWGCLIGALWTRSGIPAKTVSGLLLGLVGVMILVGFEHLNTMPGVLFASICALCAASSYGVASVYTKSVTGVLPFANAHGSMWGATLWLLPLLPFFPVTTVPSLSVISAVLALGILCSGVAFLLFFRLVADIGPTSTLTVTFLIPVFGILWGYLFLDETMTWTTLVGVLCIICSIGLVGNFSWRMLFGHAK